MRSELVVPLYVAGELWGVLNVEELEVDAFDEDDVRLMETMADQAGSALRSASLYEQLERAYMGTAEALAAALEAKDSYTAEPRALDRRARRGRGSPAGDGRAAAPATSASAPSSTTSARSPCPSRSSTSAVPLTAEERVEIERHTVVGEQILAPVEFLAGARLLVRHEHERWDGARLPGPPRGHRHPARLPHHPRLRRAPRDDLRPPVPAGDVASARRGASCGPTRARSSTRGSSTALLDVIGAGSAPAASLT